MRNQTPLPNEALTAYRVKVEGGISYQAAEMSLEQIQERRSLIRQTLRGSQWEGFTESQLDAVRLYCAGQRIIMEDSEGREYILKKSHVESKEAFEPARNLLPFDFMDKEAKDFDWTLYNCDINVPKDLVNKYILNFPKLQEKGIGLYIHSKESGTGKTLLACIIRNELKKRQAFSSSFLDVGDIPVLKESSREIQEAKETDLLILDNVGQTLSKGAAGVLQGIFITRMGKGKVTLCTASVIPEKLKLESWLKEKLIIKSYSLCLPDVSVRMMQEEQMKQELLAGQEGSSL